MLIGYFPFLFKTAPFLLFVDGITHLYFTPTATASLRFLWKKHSLNRRAPAGSHLEKDGIRQSLEQLLCMKQNLH